MLFQPYVCGVWPELLDHWFGTLEKSRQDLPLLIQSTSIRPGLYPPFSAVMTSADALACVEVVVALVSE